MSFLFNFLPSYFRYSRKFYMWILSIHCICPCRALERNRVQVFPSSLKLKLCEISGLFLNMNKEKKRDNNRMWVQITEPCEILIARGLMLGSWPQNESFANFGVYLIESTMHVCFHFSFFSFHCFGCAHKVYLCQNRCLVWFLLKSSNVFR